MIEFVGGIKIWCMQSLHKVSFKDLRFIFKVKKLFQYTLKKSIGFGHSNFSTLWSTYSILLLIKIRKSTKRPRKCQFKIILGDVHTLYIQIKVV